MEDIHILLAVVVANRDLTEAVGVEAEMRSGRKGSAVLVVDLVEGVHAVADSLPAAVREGSHSPAALMAHFVADLVR